jgi:hypothetical protein
MPSLTRFRPSARVSGAVSVVLSGLLAVTAVVAAGLDVPSDEMVTTAAPTNAAKVFRWGNAQVKDEFHGSLDRRLWAVGRAGVVRNQHGMLTLNAGSAARTVTATMKGHARSVGRWEARVRTREYGSGHAAYHAVWELVPSSSSGYHCGARSIVLSDYALGSGRSRFSARNGSRQFTAAKPRDLSRDVFHTYAVEVTRSHISWFVDTQVVRTERRPAALSGAALTMRFRMVARPGATMNPGRMQMDWARYYTLERKNARSISAPALTEKAYAGSC